MKKTIYKLGDNSKYEYFIVASKKEYTLNENSLAFQFDKETEKREKVEMNGAEGNYDYILCEMDEQGVLNRHIFCLEDEIEK